MWSPIRSVIEHDLFLSVVLGRYSVLLGTALIVCGLIAFVPGILRSLRSPFERMFIGLFVLERPLQHCFAAAITFLAAGLVISTFTVTQRAGRIRFSRLDDERMKQALADEILAVLDEAEPDSLDEPIVRIRWGLQRWIWWVAMGIWIPMACIANTIRTGRRKFKTFLRHLAFSIVGAIIALIMLFVLAFVSCSAVRPSARLPGVFPWEFPQLQGVRRLEQIQSDSYIYLAANRIPLKYKDVLNDEGQARFKNRWPDAEYILQTPGLAFVVSPTDTIKDPAANSYLVRGHAEVTVSLLFIGIIYLISYWIVVAGRWYAFENPWCPAIFFVVLATMLLAALFAGVAFFFDYYRVPAALPVVLLWFARAQISQNDHLFDVNNTEETTPPIESASNVVRYRDPDSKTLVVITAPGGGIHAAAWTTTVLTGLHQRYKNRFSDRTALISAVSGGSVGTMYYITALAKIRAELDQGNDASELFRQVREAAMAPGLEAVAWGVAFPDLIRTMFPNWIDKGFDRGAVLEGFWKRQLKKKINVDPNMGLHELREQTINGTIPLAVFNGTIVETGQRMLISPLTLGAGSSAFEYLNQHPESNLRVATAARLSATFPYVSPVSRPSDLGEYHACDGGYADNEGIVTVIEALTSWLKPPQGSFERVLLLRIEHEPQAPSQLTALPGWQGVLWGPVSAMLKVRTNSQVERTEMDLTLLSSILDTNRLKVVTLPFQSSTGDPPPLSWKLTPKQKSQYDQSWDGIQETIESLAPYFDD